MQQAIDSVSSGYSINSARKRFGISEGGLRYRLKKLKDGDVKIQGKTCIFTEEEKHKLAASIKTICRLGFNPTANELMSVVSDFVRKYNIETPFKDDRQGPEC